MYPTATPPLVLNERVPDPAVKTLDPSFEKYKLPLASVERLSQGYSWAEGPVYFGDARCLLWSDIPNNRIMRWDEETGATSVYRKPSNLRQRQHPRPPGAPRHRRARPACDATEYDGRITVLMERFDGKRLNSPNDIVVKSDDSIWFTDMNAGLTGNWNGEVGEQEMPQRVYRIDGKTGQAAIVTDGVVKRPNGLAFSPDEKKLYVIESEPGARAIYAFDVDGAKLANPRKLIVCAKAETRTASASTSTATCGAAGAWVRPSSTASASSTRRARRSATSACRSARPTSASADRSEIGCSWRRAIPSTRSM
jgi:gluconolactonase